MWDIGYTYGLERKPWAAMVESLRIQLGRFLTASDRASLASGWYEGKADYAAYEHDMKSAADLCPAREYEDAIPF